MNIKVSEKQLGDQNGKKITSTCDEIINIKDYFIYAIIFLFKKKSGY